MNCQQVDEYVFSYCDGELAPLLSSEIESHVEKCPDCKAKVDITKCETDFLRTSLETPSLPADFTARVLAGLNHAGAPTELAAASLPTRPWYTRMPLWLAATAAALIMLIYTVNPNILSPIKTGDKPSSVHMAQLPYATNAQFGSNQVKPESLKSKENSKTSDNVKAPASEQKTRDLTSGEAAADKTEAPERMMLSGAAPGNPPDGALLKHGSSPDRDRARDMALKLPTGVTFDSNTSNNTPRIANMPASYKMTSSSPQEDGWLFVYQGTEGKQVTITLAANTSNENKIRNLPAPKAAATYVPSEESGNTPVAESIMNDKSNLSNSVNRAIDYNNTSYQLTISGNLTVDELNSLSNQLTVEQQK